MQSALSKRIKEANQDQTDIVLVTEHADKWTKGKPMDPRNKRSAPIKKHPQSFFLKKKLLHVPRQVATSAATNRNVHHPGMGYAAQFLMLK